MSDAEITWTPAASTVYPLITLAEAKVFPGLSGLASSQDATIEALINAATLDFEWHWQNCGVQREFTERYNWRDIQAASRSADVIWLEHYPIQSVSSITDPDSNTIDSDDYWIDKFHGCLRTTGGWTMPQDSNGFATYWTIVYTAGRVSATSGVPANIKTACKKWVYSLYKRPDREVIAKSIGDFSVTYKNDAGSGLELPPDIQRMISQWKRRDV